MCCFRLQVPAALCVYFSAWTKAFPACQLLFFPSVSRCWFVCEMHSTEAGSFPPCQSYRLIRQAETSVLSCSIIASEIYSSIFTEGFDHSVPVTSRWANNQQTNLSRKQLFMDTIPILFYFLPSGGQTVVFGVFVKAAWRAQRTIWI